MPCRPPSVRVARRQACGEHRIPRTFRVQPSAICQTRCRVSGRSSSRRNKNVRQITTSEEIGMRRVYVGSQRNHGPLGKRCPVIFPVFVATQLKTASLANPHLPVRRARSHLPELRCLSIAAAWLDRVGHMGFVCQLRGRPALGLRPHERLRVARASAHEDWPWGERKSGRLDTAGYRTDAARQRARCTVAIRCAAVTAIASTTL